MNKESYSTQVQASMRNIFRHDLNPLETFLIMLLFSKAKKEMYFIITQMS